MFKLTHVFPPKLNQKPHQIPLTWFSFTLTLRTQVSSKCHRELCWAVEPMFVYYCPICILHFGLTSWDRVALCRSLSLSPFEYFYWKFANLFVLNSFVRPELAVYCRRTASGASAPKLSLLSYQSTTFNASLSLVMVIPAAAFAAWLWMSLGAICGSWLILASYLEHQLTQYSSCATSSC